jgi:hypothetical protein
LIIALNRPHAKNAVDRATASIGMATADGVTYYVGDLAGGHIRAANLSDGTERERSHSDLGSPAWPWQNFNPPRSRTFV